MSLLETHTQIASSASGDEYLSTLGLEREDAATTQGYSTKIQYLDSLSEAVKQFDVALDKAVAGRGSAPKAAPLTVKEFGKLASRLNELSADPTPLFEAVPSDLGAMAPSLMNQAAATAARAAQYLAQVMPKPPSGSPLAPKWQPSAAQLSEFSARLNAVQDPRKALEGAVLGGSKASLDAVRSVYPSLYADFEQRLIERVMTEGSKMSYSEKLRLAPILGAQVLGLSNQQMMVVQQTHAMLQGKPSVQRPDGRQRVDTEQNLETQAQRLEGR
jgi:hypothetical protein